MAIAGGAGVLGDDRIPPTENPVEEGGLPDVGAAHDRDGGPAHAVAPASRASLKAVLKRIALSITSVESGRRPPVSTSQKRRPPHSASPKWRSRVVPACWETIASLPPRIRLKRVDFPTLGRPTIATVPACWETIAS